MAMRSIWNKKEYIALVLIILLFTFVSFTSISSIRSLQGNARVVNFGGIVRGATQKLIKEEIMGWELTKRNPQFPEQSDWYPDDALLERLDIIVNELLTGEGPNDLIVLPDEEYLANMEKVKTHWIELKKLIKEVRKGEDPQELFESSQVYFELVNDTVFSAETYSEEQVNITNVTLLWANGIFILMVILGIINFLRSLTVKKRADVLDKVAYVDHLTDMDNRASCERLINTIKSDPPDMKVCVFMFDMNDLKLTNDFLGHQGGDKVIIAFAKALKDACLACTGGFVGRYGGDEFIAIFQPGDGDVIEEFLTGVRSNVDDFNERQLNKLEMVQYAVGYIIDNPSNHNMDEMIHEADNRMYANKRELKSMR
jgi:diguanylate cyclase (GGDEF)-like protein